MVQRLDFATSGAVCMALNKKAAASAGKALASRRVTKHYLALVCLLTLLVSNKSILLWSDFDVKLKSRYAVIFWQVQLT